MSHDVKKNKLLKKILGTLGFKIFPKETIKTERFIESSSLNSGDLIKLLISKKKINNIIQIGANDGKSDDFLRTSINIDTNLLLVEPIKSAFEQLKKNYSDFKNVRFVNKAIDIKSGKKDIFSVNPKYYDFYKKKYQTEDVSWLTVLASFHKNHLEYHGIKSSHIQSTQIDCINFKKLIDQYNFDRLDLLVVDTEGYDEILITMKEDKKKYFYIIYNTKTKKIKSLNSKLNKDGHPMFNPKNKDLFVSDTYPNLFGFQKLFIFSLSKNKVIWKRFIYSPYKFSGILRCDLHPRWSNDGKKIFVDFVENANRNIGIFETQV